MQECTFPFDSGYIKMSKKLVPNDFFPWSPFERILIFLRILTGQSLSCAVTGTNMLLLQFVYKFYFLKFVLNTFLSKFAAGG